MVKDRRVKGERVGVMIRWSLYRERESKERKEKQKGEGRKRDSEEERKRGGGRGSVVCLLSL